jgi:hypothetical protein
VAWPSALVKWTVPVYPTTVLPLESLAVTVTENSEPAVADVGAVTIKWSAVAATITDELDARAVHELYTAATV